MFEAERWLAAHWNWGIMPLRIDGERPGRNSVTIVFLVLLLASVTKPSRAQQQLASTLPDAPAATPQKQSDQPPAGQSSVVTALLRGRSKVFPDLAFNTKPLTTEEKFGLFVRDSISIFNVVGSGMAAGISQARDTQSGYGQGAEGYFKRFGASMTYGASNNFFGTFLIASLLHEDPRYFVKDSGSFGERVRYAATRVVVTRSDRGGHVINWAGLLGPLAGAALANTYLPADSQGVGNTFSRWGITLGATAGTNLLREYWPTINKKLRLPKMDITPAGTVEPTATPSTPAPQPH